MRVRGSKHRCEVRGARCEKARPSQQTPKTFLLGSFDREARLGTIEAVPLAGGGDVVVLGFRKSGNRNGAR